MRSMRRQKRPVVDAKGVAGYERLSREGDVRTQAAGLAVVARDLQLLVAASPGGDDLPLYGAFRTYLTSALRLGASSPGDPASAQVKIDALGSVVETLSRAGLDGGHAAAMLAEAVGAEARHWGLSGTYAAEHTRSSSPSLRKSH